MVDGIVEGIGSASIGSLNIPPEMIVFIVQEMTLLTNGVSSLDPSRCVTVPRYGA